MDEFTAALEAGSWSAIIGLALLMLAPTANNYLSGKISPYAERWVSLARGVALGIGPMLAVGGTWWIVLTVGLVGLAQSAGFTELVRAVIPDYKAPSAKKADPMTELRIEEIQRLAAENERLQSEIDKLRGIPG